MIYALKKTILHAFLSFFIYKRAINSKYIYIIYTIVNVGSGCNNNKRREREKKNKSMLFFSSSLNLICLLKENIISTLKENFFCIFLLEAFIFY